MFKNLYVVSVLPPQNKVTFTVNDSFFDKNKTHIQSADFIEYALDWIDRGRIYLTEKNNFVVKPDPDDDTIVQKIANTKVESMLNHDWKEYCRQNNRPYSAKEFKKAFKKMISKALSVMNDEKIQQEMLQEGSLEYTNAPTENINE